jgi:hypothetical protein
VGLDLDWFDVPGAGIFEESRMLGSVLEMVVRPFECLDDGGTVNNDLGSVTGVDREKSCRKFNGEEFGSDGGYWPFVDSLGTRACSEREMPCASTWWTAAAAWAISG